jgi:hypothetical protein
MKFSFLTKRSEANPSREKHYVSCLRRRSSNDTVKMATKYFHVSSSSTNHTLAFSVRWTISPRGLNRVLQAFYYLHSEVPPCFLLAGTATSYQAYFSTICSDKVLIRWHPCRVSDESCLPLQQFVSYVASPCNSGPSILGLLSKLQWGRIGLETTQAGQTSLAYRCADYEWLVKFHTMWQQAVKLVHASSGHQKKWAFCKTYNVPFNPHLAYKWIK